MSIKVDRSFPVTAKLIEELISENQVVETGYAASTGGRRALTYALQGNVMYLVAVAMDQFVTKIAIMDMENNFVSPIQKVVLLLSAVHEPIQVLAEKIDQLVNTSGIPKEKFVGI